MGNCPACLSSKQFDYSADHPQEEDPDLPASADVLSEPLLKPSMYGDNHYTGKLRLNMQGGMRFPSPNMAEQHFLAPAAPESTKEKQLKLNKKVRFADKVLIISTCTHQEMAPFISSASEGESTEELFHKKKNESSKVVDQSSRVVNPSSNIVRVKVVISKKELSELILKNGEKQGSNALVERIVAPLLFPQSSLNKSQTFNVQQLYGSPTWRPSLEHIPEDH